MMKTYTKTRVLKHPVKYAGVYLRSKALDRKMKKGLIHRGRQITIHTFTYWEELKLRLRALRAALKFLITFKKSDPDDPVYQGEIFPTGRLFVKQTKSNGQIINHGLVATKVVTDVGVQYIVDSFQNSSTTPLDVMKYHECGTGNTAEAAGDTALVTAIESRATGSLAAGSSANIFKTVGTVAMTGTHAVVEHGVFSASSVGTLLDRSVFSAINVVSGDSIEFTYQLTLPSGS